MGFPREALDHLIDSDLQLIKEAVHVEVENELLMFDSEEILMRKTEK